MSEKKYSGYGYHGGGRPRLDPNGERRIYKTVSVSGTPEQIQQLREKAKAEGLTVSKYVLKMCL